MKPFNQEDMDERQQAAEHIIKNSGHFKVCEACDSIVGKRAAQCPNCQNYRFNEDKEYVKSHAKEIASRPPVSVHDWE